MGARGGDIRNGSLSEAPSTAATARRAFRALTRLIGAPGRVGFDPDPVAEPSSYSSVYQYGVTVPRLFRQAFAGAATLVPAGDVFARLRAVKTIYEVAQIRRACMVAGEAYEKGAPGFMSV